MSNDVHENWRGRDAWSATTTRDGVVDLDVSWLVPLWVVLVAGLAVFLIREQRRYHAIKARHDADA